MPNWLITLIPIICMLVPLAGVFGYLKYLQREDRRSPITEDLLRLPGETLNEQFRGLAFDLCGVLTVSILIPAIGLITLLNKWVDPARIQLNLDVILMGIFIMAGLSWTLWKTLKILSNISITRRGLEGELATAQLLTPLLADGWHLFNDLPMKRGNIDHVLVGPTGVYAIETKYRSKRQSLKGKEGAQVSYDGNCIRFAGGTSEQLPLQQAQAVAVELSKWLLGKLGQPVTVAAVVALPGWYVRTTNKPSNGQAYVINPKAHSLFQKRPTALDESIQIRVCAALRELAVRERKGVN